MRAEATQAGPKPYHHGDLRAALLRAGLTALADEAGGGFSLRALARTVGVSANAVYRHFPDKQALMAALANAGLEQLSAAQHDASDAAGGGAAGFLATGRAYVRFALDNPALFRLIFSAPARGDVMAAAPGDRPEAMRFLRANATAFAPPGVDAEAMALQAWSVAHGLAMLMLDGLLPADDALIALVFRAGLGVAL